MRFKCTNHIICTSAHDVRVHQLKRTGGSCESLDFFQFFAVAMSPLCGATGTPCFRLWLTLAMGFKVRVDVPSPAIVSHMRVMDPQSELWPGRGTNHEPLARLADALSIRPHRPVRL